MAAMQGIVLKFNVRQPMKTTETNKTIMVTSEKRIEIPLGRHLMGRHKSSLFLFSDETVSRVQCYLTHQIVDGKSCLFVENEGNPDGALLNMERIEGRMEIKQYDTLHIGNVKFTMM